MPRVSPIELTAATTQQHKSSLEKLPSEVLDQILSNLTPYELTSIRLVSRSIFWLATSNTHWRRIVIQDLLPSYVALQDIAELPPRLLSLSLAEDGWFQAFLTLHKVARDPWLRRDEDLYQRVFMVYFKSHIRQGGAGLEDYHALCEFTRDNWAKTLDGLPLEPKRFAVIDGDMIVSAYPPNIAGRDPRTWCRTFEHISVMMVSDAPEFLVALIELNSKILREAVRNKLIGQAEASEREQWLGERARAIFERPGSEMAKVLQERHSVAGSRRGNSERHGSEPLDEWMREDDYRIEGEETESDSDESLDESLHDREMENTDEREAEKRFESMYITPMYHHQEK